MERHAPRDAAAIRGADAARCASFRRLVARCLLTAVLTQLPSATARLEDACGLDFSKAVLYLDPNILASLLCQRSAQAVRLPLCSPQLVAPSLPFLPDTPTTPPRLNCSARCCRRRAEPFWI